MTIEPEPLLLDTHVWIWLNEGASELDAAAIRQIDRAATQGRAFVSVMSIWEVSLLHAKGRVRIGLRLPTWVDRALAPPLSLAMLTPQIAIECHDLPSQLHNDPVDRILVATARIERLTLVTRDRAILEYANKGHVAALPC